MPPSIHLAINANCAEMVKLIFETDPDSIYARDQEGWSTLHMVPPDSNLTLRRPRWAIWKSLASWSPNWIPTTSAKTKPLWISPSKTTAGTVLAFWNHSLLSRNSKNRNRFNKGLFQKTKNYRQLNLKILEINCFKSKNMMRLLKNTLKQ